MTVLNFNTTVDIDGAVKMVQTVGEEVTYLFVSEPGVGKTSILRELAIRNGDQWRDVGDNYPTDKYEYVYIDAPNKRDGDLFLVMPDRDTKALEQYTTGLINVNDPRPKIIMIDEVLKVLRSMKPLFTRLILERCVGDTKLTKGTKIFATSNNASDGVDDTIQAHFGNRICRVQLRKTSAERWANGWATLNGISAVTRACVSMNPRLMASYLDSKGADNPYVFNPTTNPVTFVSPRSLAIMDAAVRKRGLLGEELTTATIEGTCGKAFAQLMSSFLAMERELIDPRKPIEDPVNTPLPSNPAALIMLMYNMVDLITTQDELSNAATYVQRIEAREMQAVFVSMITDNDRLTKLGSTNVKVGEWMRKNYRIAR